MPRTVVLAKEIDGARSTVLLIADRKQSLGKCRGVGNYVVIRPNRKYYRVESMLSEYKRYKADGYRYSHMY